MAGNGPRLPKYLSAGLMPGHPAERVLYLTELAETRAHVLRPDTGDRLTLEWSARAFPYAWVWINQRASRFPWFGRLSSIAVEPVNVWPADGLAAAVRARSGPGSPGPWECGSPPLVMWKRPWEWSYQRRSEMVANIPTWKPSTECRHPPAA